MLCPICDRDNDLDARRCKACGADFEDPEVAAQLVRPIRAGTSADDDEPNLSGDRYLGVRWIGLEVGGDLRKIALLGGIAFAVAALVPIALDLQHVKAVWSVLGSGPTFVLVVPFVLALVGIALATPLGKRVPPAVVAAVLALGGALTIGLVVARQGGTSALSTRTWWGPWFGVAIMGAGLIIRILRRRDPYARWIVLGGAAIALIGMIVPFTDSRVALPAEYELFLRGRDLVDTSIASASSEGFEGAPMVRFISIWHLALFPLVGVAAGFALGMSKGPWDSSGLVLRPIGWALVFWLPASLALYTINIMGWHGYDYARWNGQYYDWEKFTTALFFGRARLLFVTIPAAAWLSVGLAGLYANLVVPRLPGATAGPGRSASAR
ncbi:MAG: hypothetical protein IPL61_40370 [Myxococcales bacterium]|nr:hypothetical protein [Myxococcales bacterium]